MFVCLCFAYFNCKSEQYCLLPGLIVRMHTLNALRTQTTALNKPTLIRLIDHGDYGFIS